MIKLKRAHTTPVFWIVLSPEYEYSYGSEYEPPEWTRDVLFVRALSAKRAKILAIRAWRRGWGRTSRMQKRITRYKPYIVQDTWINPMAEITVHRPLLEGPYNTKDTRVL